MDSSGLSIKNQKLDVTPYWGIVVPIILTILILLSNIVKKIWVKDIARNGSEDALAELIQIGKEIVLSVMFVESCHNERFLDLI